MCIIATRLELGCFGRTITAIRAIGTIFYIGAVLVTIVVGSHFGVAFEKS